MDSPIGRLQLAEEDGKLTHLLFVWHNTLADLGLESVEKETPLLKKSEEAAEGIFRRQAQGLRPASGSGGNSVPAEVLGRAARDPLRRDAHV